MLLFWRARRASDAYEQQRVTWVISPPERDLTATSEAGKATRSTGEQPNRRVVVLPHNVWRWSRILVPPAEPTVA